MKLEVGMRVRINFPASNAHGDIGTIWKIEEDYLREPPDNKREFCLCYCVDIDGHGKYYNNKYYVQGEIAFKGSRLIPIFDNDQSLTYATDKQIPVSWDDCVWRPKELEKA